MKKIIETKEKQNKIIKISKNKKKMKKDILNKDQRDQMKIMILKSII